MIDWSNISTVLLDMDGTLLDLHYDNYFWLTHMPLVYAQQNDIDETDVMDVLEPKFKQHEGTLNWYCVNFWSQELGLDIMSHKQDVAGKIAWRTGAKAFLQRCARHTDNVHLVTNAHREVLNLKHQHTSIKDYFSSTLCSHELEMPKEAPQFWQLLHSQYGFDPEQTLFIDDSDAVLDAAYSFGVTHLYSIAQPDSKKVREVPSKYPMLDDLNHLFALT